MYHLCMHIHKLDNIHDILHTKHVFLQCSYDIRASMERQAAFIHQISFSYVAEREYVAPTRRSRFANRVYT